MCGVAESDIESPIQLDYLIDCNDDYKCLTQLANRYKENKCLKKYKGDGWNDVTQKTTFIHTNISTKENNYNVDEIDSAMYTYKQVGI